MSAVLKAHIIRIGNSRGIRIPKVCLDQLGLDGEVELAVQPDRLVIRPARRPRKGWEEQFRAMAERGDDKLLDAPTATKWDETEWEW
ncbi:MAG TPA: AbrB/MazE/SpoVT family DNA-binding domain-containing protein [Planctomycetota bacterium]|nr:AbrB/MazE/SpoVT family DNA-binding domain-containing protein [Planctomycetota bacterium]HRR82381.1 AbrB/MazE/SpoVT family DNA-binding domain-containing protein [Planctomycetota bacterium]HRT94891.1 AbrB/MazE/SpoVT family DNA-binding domain-containing protein [Planctomycetota bacterium]